MMVIIKADMNPNQIYKQALNYTVELKCSKSNSDTVYATAVLIDLKGYYVTNAHVVTQSINGNNYDFEIFEIRYYYEKEYQRVTLEKYDTKTDLAILKGLPQKKSFKVNLEYQTADRVYAIGNLNETGIAITSGIISNKEVIIKSKNTIFKVIQTDLTISYGNSGGALVNSKGQLIGIISFRNKDNKGNVIYGLAYCIPINDVMIYLE